MRELTMKEMDSVNGGILPVIAAIVVIDVALIGVTYGVVSSAEEQAAESGHTENC